MKSPNRNEHWQLIGAHVEYVPHGFLTCTGILCLRSEACIKLHDFFPFKASYMHKQQNLTMCKNVKLWCISAAVYLWACQGFVCGRCMLRSSVYRKRKSTKKRRVLCFIVGIIEESMNVSFATWCVYWACIGNKKEVKCAVLQTDL